MTVHMESELMNSLSWAFSYDVPSLHNRGVLLHNKLPHNTTHVSQRTGNVPVAAAGAGGDVVLVLVGRDLSTYSVSATLRVGSTASEESVWTSDTSLRCKVAGGVSRTLRLAVSVVFDLGTLSEAVSTDTSRQVLLPRCNVPASGSVHIQISGEHMAQAGYSHALAIGATSAESTSWISTTSSVGLSTGSSSGSLRVALTVGLGVGSKTQAISTDAALMMSGNATGITSLSNSPSTGSVRLRVLGSNLAQVSMSLSAHQLGTAAEATSWQADTSVEVGVARGLARHPLDTAQGAGPHVVTVAQVTGQSSSRAFSIDMPVLTSVYTGNGPHAPYHLNTTRIQLVFDQWGNASNSTITLTSTIYTSTNISGANLGSAQYSVRVHLGSSDTPATFWRSDSQVTCRLRSSSGASHAISVTVTSSHVMRTASGSMPHLPHLFVSCAT